MSTPPAKVDLLTVVMLAVLCAGPLYFILWTVVQWFRGALPEPEPWEHDGERIPGDW